MRKPEKFLLEPHPDGSYFRVLQRFLRREAERNSPHTVDRLYYSLHPLGKKLENPPLAEISRNDLHTYQQELWLTHAAETVRTVTADIRHFFKWCKKRGHHSRNPAKRIKSVNATRSPRRRAHAVPESDVTAVLNHLSTQLQHLIYRDIFGNLTVLDLTAWDNHDRRALRDLLALTFLYETGARAGELSKLGSHAMNEAIGKPSPACTYTVTVTGKTENRNRHFTQSTAELWHIWEQVRPAGADEYAITGWKRTDPPQSISANGISNMLARRCEEARVKVFRANSLRHAKIKRARLAFGLEVTGRLMDHSSLKSTMNYANIESDELTKATQDTGLQIDLWTGKPKNR